MPFLAQVLLVKEDLYAIGVHVVSENFHLVRVFLVEEDLRLVGILVIGWVFCVEDLLVATGVSVNVNLVGVLSLLLRMISIL